jgi:hypothetical protein
MYVHICIYIHIIHYIYILYIYVYINVKVPHAVTALMNSQGHKWLTNSRMIHYQGLLCKNPWVQLETMWTLNTTTFLPTEAGILNHNCEELIDEIYSSRPDLTDTPPEPRTGTVH